MKSHRRLPTFAVLMTAITFACSLFTPPTTAQTPLPPPLVIEPTPTTSPKTPSAPLNLPRGVVTSAEGNSSLTVFDRQCYTLSIIRTPGLSYSSPENTHIVGNMPEGLTTVPVVYFSFEQNESLLLNTNDQVSTLLTTPHFAGMVGVPGKPIVAYTTVDYGDNALFGKIFISPLQSLPAAAPALTIEDPEGWAIVVLAIRAQGDQPLGVWYSRRPWGIGGDIVFDPRRILNYLDLTTGISSQILGPEVNPSSLSFDQTWVAYTSDTSVGSGVGAMFIRNLQTGASATFPLLPGPEQRGAGEAVFSPGNQYVAWMEGSGWLMAEVPTFHSVVRVGDMNGNVVAEFADTALVNVSGLGTIGRVEPVGWFDDQTLVLQAHGTDWDQVVLMLVDIPSKVPTFLARGVFVGFVYP